MGVLGSTRGRPCLFSWHGAWCLECPAGERTVVTVAAQPLIIHCAPST